VSSKIHQELNDYLPDMQTVKYADTHTDTFRNTSRTIICNVYSPL